MTQRLFVAVLTVVVFTAGYAARMFTAGRAQPVPPPPAAIARELAPAAGQKSDGKGRRGKVDRAEIVADIRKMRPQIEAYVAQVHEIEAEFDREFNAVLNPQQREKRLAYLKKRAELEAKRVAEREPLSDDTIARERERPLTDIYWMVTVTPRLERLTREYKLDDTQQTATRALLSLRRNKYIALFEATPHPSLRLSRLAPVVERVTPKSGK